MTAEDPLMRFGVTMEQSLLTQIDRLVEEEGYSSRSEFLRRLARDAVIQAEYQIEDREVVGTLTLLYEHRNVNLGHVLNSLQHDYPHVVSASLHVHLDTDDCLEVLVLNGSSHRVRELARELYRLRGVKLAKLSLAHSSSCS